MATNNHNFKFNKGEWSELYVFLKILSEGKLYAARLNPKENKLENNGNIFYSVRKVIKGSISYIEEVENDYICVEDPDNEVHEKVSKKEFQDNSLIVLRAITEGKGTFEIPEISAFLKKINLTSIKTRSSSKGDIIIQVHDIFTNTNPQISFSIKSYLGSHPTLLNASEATKFIFETEIVENTANKIDLSTLSRKMEIQGNVSDKFEELRKVGGKLTFKKCNNEIFERNLKMIDTKMPQILADLYYYSYFVSGKKMSKVVEYYCAEKSEDLDLIEYKIKELLCAIALGMVPKTKWTGLDEANGGYIVVESNGEIACFHIYDRNRLKEYLYNTSKFDSPSLSRYNAAKINDKRELSLVCQIRF